MGRRSKKGTIHETERVIVTIPKHLSDILDYISEYRRLEKSIIFQNILEHYIKSDEVVNERRGIDAIINDYNKKMDTATEVTPTKWKYIRKFIYSDPTLLNTYLSLRDKYDVFDEFCEAMFERFVDEGKIDPNVVVEDDDEIDENENQTNP